MIKYGIIILIICVSISESWASNSPVDTLDHFPSYRVKGGKPAFYDSVGKAIVYPFSAIQSKIVGTAVVSFILTPEGKITDYQIINSLSKDIDYELIKAFKGAEEIWLADPAEDKNYILYVPVIFLLNKTKFPLTSHEAGFMMEEIKIEASVFDVGKANDYDNHVKKAFRAYEHRNYRRAIRHLNELIERNPFSQELYKLRGFSYYKLKKYEEACQDYQKIKVLLHKPIPKVGLEICNNQEPI